VGQGTWGQLARAGSVGSGHTYVLGSRGGARALSHMSMWVRAASVPHRSARGSVGTIGSVG
jgi:hypothetical protein